MRYIRFNTKTNKIIAVCKNKPLGIAESEFTSLDGDFAIAVFDGEFPKGPCLSVSNVCLKDHTWFEPNLDNESNEAVIEKTRTYISCSVVASTEPSEWEARLKKAKIIAEKKALLNKYREDVEQVSLFGITRADYTEKKELCRQLVLELRELEKSV